MKRKMMMTAGAALLAVIMLTVPAAQAFAVSALSVFRVGDTKTIKITMEDIQFAADYMTSHRDELAADMKSMPDLDVQADAAGFDRPEQRILDSVDDFTAFSFNLPKALQDEQPEITALSGFSKTLQWEGEQVSLHVPAAISAQYEDLIVAATQAPYLEATDHVKKAIQKQVLDLPMLSENLKSQLSQIDIDSRDIYLPVILGVGRSIDLGGNTGYIYATADVKTLVQSLPENLSFASELVNSDDGFSVLIWTKNGVLYAIAGNKADGELAKIARSI